MRRPPSHEPPALQLGFPFTERDAPAIRARIERDLQRIASRLVANDPRLRSLVLAGGFARGEGTVRDGAPVNDYDLVAVRDAPGSDVAYRRMARAMTEQLGIEVDILPVWSPRLAHVGRKLFWLDLRLSGRVLWGDMRILRALPPFEPTELAPTEIARLLGNRAAGLLLAIPGRGEREDAAQRDLQATKAILSAMDAFLLHGGRYAPDLRGRLALARDHPKVALFRTAVAWKLVGGPADPTGAAWWEAARDLLLDAVDATGARDARDGSTERLFHLQAAGRFDPQPSQRVRLAAWDLLRAATYPDGPTTAQPWPAEKAGFFLRRSRTLQ